MERPSGSSFQLPSHSGSAGGGANRMGGDRPSQGPARRPEFNPGGGIRPGGDRPSQGPADRPGFNPERPGVRPGSDNASQGIANRVQHLDPNRGPMEPGGDRKSWGPQNRANNFIDNRPGNNGVRPGSDHASWGPANQIANRFPDARRPGGNDMRPGGDRKSWGPENRKDYWNNWQDQHQAQINNFKKNKDNNWNQINNYRNSNNHATFNSANWQNYNNSVHNYWDNRSLEVKNDINVNADHLFNDGWWSNHPGATFGAGVAAGATAAWASHWWWNPCSYTSLSTFLPWSWPAQPPVYDYGTNVVYEGDTVYVNGQSSGSAAQYSQQAVTLAMAPQDVPPPMPPAGGTADAPPPPTAGDWMPLGVWALAPEEHGDASMFFQISINKAGVISGGYSNVMSGEDAPISGQADQKSKRAAWHINNNSKTVFEAGLTNLTKDSAPCLVHYGAGEPQTWLLVRLPNSEIPAAPTSLDAAQTK